MHHSLIDRKVLAAMKISSALVDVTLELVAVKDRNAKQLEAEKARLKQISGTNEKLDVLIQKKNEVSSTSRSSSSVVSSKTRFIDRRAHR